MRIHTLLIVIAIVIGIYVLPGVVATFAGSHTMELNESDGIYSMKCTKCHKYISDEMGATDLAVEVATKHLNAAWDSNYIGSDGEINISKSELPGLMPNVCLLCHLAEQTSISIAGSHTKIIIRVCTDDDCHGNSTSMGSEIVYPETGSVGLNLSSANDAHSEWFNGMESRTSSYINEDGGNYSTGFYTCLGCHTHVGMSMNLTRPQVFNINVTRNESGVFISTPAMNYTTLNETMSYKPAHTSMWT